MPDGAVPVTLHTVKHDDASAHVRLFGQGADVPPGAQVPGLVLLLFPPSQWDVVSVDPEQTWQGVRLFHTSQIAPVYQQ
jgi:hypothetical protein